ncbi:MAG: hypothetical protein HY281_01610 [Nitrospirae bacterium]|nr:hypothetical protein [Nitrospirota bacterium]
MRKTLTRALYLVCVDLIALYLVVLPAYAFQVSSSTTGYVRVASQAAVSTMLTAQRAATVASLATGISASTAGSVAVRLVASSVGWPVLGIVAGMTLAMYVYDQTKVAALKTAAAPPGLWDIPGYVEPAGSTIGACTSVGGPCPFANTTHYILVPSAAGVIGCNPSAAGAVPSGWSGWFSFGNNCHAIRGSGSASPVPVQGAASPATPAQVQSYLGNLPASDPLSLESNTQLVGAQSQPTPADSTSAVPVPETGLATTVVPATSVQPTDLVVNPNVNPPTGTVTTKTQTQPTTGTKTTTTTTTTNPDGSVTTTSTETGQDTAPVSCAAGNHEPRTFGSILQEHMNLWTGSGLLSALNLLKTLTWPTTIPTYSLQSNLLGNFTLDFSAWSGMLTAIRSIVIAIAGFVAYRMIFVGAR